MNSIQIVFIIEICIIAFVIWIAWSSAIGAPWIPTPKNKVRAMLNLAKVNKNDILYDLGSGDGRIIIMAAKDFGAQSIGIEMDPIRLLWSRLSIKWNNVNEKVRIIRANFFDVNLQDATVVTLYQGYKINKRIREKLAKELKNGTRVVSYRFVLDGWTPMKTSDDGSIYLYIA
jgi:ribosomal protein L11 methylase PrmA